MHATGGQSSEVLHYHSLHLCFPFFHRLGNGSGRERTIRDMLGRWQWWGEGIWLEAADPVRTLATIMDEALFFLPQARHVLFPEFVDYPATETGARALWKEVGQRRERGQLAQWLAQWPTVHLQLRADFWEPLRRPWVYNSVAGRAVPVEVSRIEALLFPNRVGVLAIRCRLAGASRWGEPGGVDVGALTVDDTQPRLGDLSFAAFNLRTIYPLKLDWVLPYLVYPEGACRRAKGGECAPCTMLVRQLLDFLLQDIAAPAPTTQAVEQRPAGGSVQELEEFCRCYPWPATERARSASAKECGQRPFYYTETEEAKLFAPLVPVYAYGCIDDPAATREPGAVGAPYSRADRLLFELSQGLEPGQSVEDRLWQPDAARVAELMERGGLRLWDLWRAVVAETSAWYLAFEPLDACVGSPDGDEGFIAHNIGTDYFYLFLYCLYQRTVLQLMAEASQVDWERPSRDLLRRTRRLVREFMTFRNRSWFADVTSREQGEIIYDTYRKALALPELYEAVGEGVKDISEYHEALYEQQVSRLLGIITVIGLPLASVLGFYEIAGTEQWHLAQWVQFAGALGAALLAGLGLWKWATG